jgi:uncharacterized coiled-coil protein SlyX
MRKRIIRSLTATVLITSIMGMTVLADEVTDIKNQQNSLAQEKQNVEDELAFLLTQMDELELSMAQKNDEIEKANKDLASAQQKFNSQQDDMKLRIKYMYEDQSTSLSEVFLSSKNMSEVLNKAEYVQQVYDYDRSKLDEMSNTRSLILLQKLEKYPIIPVNAHVRPFHNYWLNMAIGIVIPIGLFFYFRIWAFRIRLNKDMERIIALNRDVELTIKDINNENKI